VLAIGLHDNYQDRQIVDEVIAPLGELKMLEPTTAREYGTDSLSFDEVGVPGFWVRAGSGRNIRRRTTASRIRSTKVWKDDVNQGAQVLAAWAYSTAQTAGDVGAEARATDCARCGEIGDAENGSDCRDGQENHRAGEDGCGPAESGTLLI